MIINRGIKDLEARQNNCKPRLVAGSVWSWVTFPCPQKDRDTAAKSSQFFVCQGPLGPTNSVFMQQRTVLESTIAAFAGIRTDAHEAIVDTAAEEAVLGSVAMEQLKQALSRKGLQPVQVHGETASCAGIGGSANIVAVWGIPIGIAKTNGLIRATEIRDSAGFETPFLLPISYQELVGAVVDVKTNMFHLDNGKKAPMRRLPSKHRTVSVVDFALPWQLPEALRKELRIEEGNPFFKPMPPRRSHGLEQGPGVAVWLKTREGDYKKIGNLPGAPTTLVHPAVLESTIVKNLTDFRITAMQPIDCNPFNIRGVWKSSRNQRSFSPTQEKPGGLKAMFEKACLGKGERPMRAEVHAVSRPDHNFAAFHRAMKPRESTNFLSGANTEFHSHLSEAGDFSAQKQSDSVKGDHVAPPHREAVGLYGSGDTRPKKRTSARILASWLRLVNLIAQVRFSVMQQMVLDYVIKRKTGSSMSSNPAPVEQKPQKSDVHKIRRGIGKPLSPSTTCTNWPSQPLECARVADRLRQRGTKGCFWWTCLDSGSWWERVEPTPR